MKTYIGAGGAWPVKMNYSHKLTAEQILEARRLRAEGKTYLAISKRLGTNIARVWKAAPSNRKRVKTHLKKARALRAKGLTYLEIGEKLGISHTSVWWLCQRFEEGKNS